MLPISLVPTFVPINLFEMKQLIFTLIGSLILLSCGGGEDKSEETEKNKEKAAQIKDDANSNKKEFIANAESSIQIEGMVCEHACVSSVKKNILAMEGVSGIEMDFVKDRKINSCIVKYDNSLVSEEDFVKKINEINDGAYKVVVEDSKTNDEPKIKELKTEKKSKLKNNDVSEFLDLDNSIQASGSNMGDSFFSFPSLFDFFTFGF